MDAWQAANIVLCLCALVHRHVSNGASVRAPCGFSAEGWVLGECVSELDELD